VAKNNRSSSRIVKPPEAPKDLSKEDTLYGLSLDPYQKLLRDAIYDRRKEIVFCNACAGSGKTTVSICTAVLMHEYELYDNLVYIVHSVGDAQGYLPGDITQKSSVLFEPLYQALIVAGQNPESVITKESLYNQKYGISYVTAITDTYLRGSNIGSNDDTILIIDEAQNFDEFSLRKTLTRACPGTKVIVIGHDGQIDLANKSRSGFIKCRDHFLSKHDDRVASCDLKINHRGFVSQVADESWD